MEDYGKAFVSSILNQVLDYDAKPTQYSSSVRPKIIEDLFVLASIMHAECSARKGAVSKWPERALVVAFGVRLWLGRGVPAPTGAGPAVYVGPRAKEAPCLACTPYEGSVGALSVFERPSPGVCTSDDHYSACVSPSRVDVPRGTARGRSRRLFPSVCFIVRTFGFLSRKENPAIR